MAFEIRSGGWCDGVRCYLKVYEYNEDMYFYGWTKYKRVFSEDPFWSMTMNEICDFVQEVWGKGAFTDYKAYVEDPNGEVVKTGTIRGNLRALTLHHNGVEKTVWLAKNSPYWEMNHDAVRVFVKAIFGEWSVYDWSGCLDDSEIFGYIVEIHDECIRPEFKCLETGDDIPGMPGKKALVIKSRSYPDIVQLRILDENHPDISDWWGYNHDLIKRTDGSWHVKEPYDPYYGW